MSFTYIKNNKGPTQHEILHFLELQLLKDTNCCLIDK